MQHVLAVIALGALLGCAPPVSLPSNQWARPVAVAGVHLRIPIPAGFVDACLASPGRLQELARTDRKLKTLGCYRGTRRAVGGLRARLSALGGTHAVSRREFADLKLRLRESANATQATLAGEIRNDSQTAGPVAVLGASVLDEIHVSRDHVVHALARYTPDGALQPGIMATVHVRGRLLYLVSFADPGTSFDWQVVGATYDAWALELVARTLWAR